MLEINVHKYLSGQKNSGIIIIIRSLKFVYSSRFNFLKPSIYSLFIICFEIIRLKLRKLNAIKQNWNNKIFYNS